MVRTKQVICLNASFTLPPYTAIFCRHNPSRVPITLLHTSSTAKYARSGGIMWYYLLCIQHYITNLLNIHIRTNIEDCPIFSNEKNVYQWLLWKSAPDKEWQTLPLSCVVLTLMCGLGPLGIRWWTLWLMLFSDGISRKNSCVSNSEPFRVCWLLPFLPVHSYHWSLSGRNLSPLSSRPIQRQPIAPNWRQLHYLSFLVLAISSGTF